MSTVLVYGNNSGEPCYSSSGYSASWCNQAYRWYVDRVIDPRDNTMTYYYARHQRSYGANNGTAVRTYDASKMLVRVEYGTRLGAEGGTVRAPMQVVTGAAFRCNANNVCDVDVPTGTDVSCAVGVSSCAARSPGFFQDLRLVRVETQVYDTTLSPAGYVPVDSWDLAHDYPDAGGGTGGVLWLRTVTHTGYSAAGALSEPAVKLDGISLANRIGGSQSYNRYRLNGITNGVGG